LGEKTASLLGNANLTVAMRQQDAGRTREWIAAAQATTTIQSRAAAHDLFHRQHPAGTACAAWAEPTGSQEPKRRFHVTQCVTRGQFSFRSRC